jgi:acyl-[acyl-carrier-protein] desaturase
MMQEREIFRALEETVEEGLKRFPPPDERGWKPAQFFDFMERKSYEEELNELRKGAKNLSDALLVTLVGSTITEEALPSYAMRSNYLAQDGTGTSDDPWSRWQRAWNAEENQHGDALHQYLLLSGRVDMNAVDLSTQHLIVNGFPQSPNPYHVILYPMFQEPIAKVGHANTARLARAQGDSVLATLCGKIAGDEARHALFFRDIGRKLFELTPGLATIYFASLMTQGINMPSELMADARHDTPSTLYRNFGEVARSIDMYTPTDYADILDDLNRQLGIQHLHLQGDAARAQAKLLKIPGRMRKVAERRERILHKTVPFDWIYGREA